MRATHLKENVKPLRNKTSVLLEIFVELIRNAYVTENYITPNHSSYTYGSQAACGKNGTLGSRAGEDRNNHPFLFSKQQKSNIHESATL